MSSPSASLPATGSRRGLLVVALAFAAIVLDGFDLMVYGAMVPALLEHPTWGLTATDVGLIGSYATFGMLVGALGVGALTDILGRRRIIIASIIWLNAATAATAMAPTPSSSASSACWPASASAASCRRRSRSRWSTPRVGSSSSTTP